MAMDTKNAAAREASDKTYFAPGTSFEGTLTTPGDVEIAGEFTGEIVSDGKVSLRKVGDVAISARDLELLAAVFKGDVTVVGDVIVDAQSSLEGNIRSGRVLCEGEIRGNLNVREDVVLGEGARVIGDVTTPSMDVALGAVIRGQLRMTET
ncbi:MAG: polymer-forming cytoskeletal protein [Ruminococcaceae bacterium]|nr:polymer-forming cytoskeletal protein [Oscillospiraceae bacterium]